MTDACFTLSRKGPADVIRVAGPLDRTSSLRLGNFLFDRLDAGSTDLVIDLTRSRYLDASAVDILLHIKAVACRRSGNLRVTGAAGAPLETLKDLNAARQLGVNTATAGRHLNKRFERTAQQPSQPAADDIPAATTAQTVAGVPSQRTRRDGPDPEDCDEITVMLRRLHAADEPASTRSRLRDEIVRRCLPYAQKLSRRFTGLGEATSDLEQVAALGLLKAVDGFDPRYTCDFRAYATPTIVGELKRHFRDKGWAVRVPRRYQELRMDVARCRDELSQRLGRWPTVSDLANHLDIDTEQVREAMVAANGYRSVSLFTPLGDTANDLGLVDRLGEPEAGYAAVELRESIQLALERLPQREQRIVAMRFFGNMSQSQIAAQIGISQMHVSRLLSRSLTMLRRVLVDG